MRNLTKWSDQTPRPKFPVLIADRQLFIGQDAKAFWSASFFIPWAIVRTDVKFATCASVLDLSNKSLL